MDLQDFDPDRSWLLPLTPGQAIWYIGTENSIRKGLNLLFANLNKYGHILIEEPVIFDYLYYGKVLTYVILYSSLSKLEYLEYKYQESASKGV